MIDAGASEIYCRLSSRPFVCVIRFAVVIFVIYKIDLIKFVSIELVVLIREIEVSSIRLSERAMEISKYEIQTEMSVDLKKCLGRHHEILIAHPLIADTSQDLEPRIIYVLLI